MSTYVVSAPFELYVDDPATIAGAVAQDREGPATMKKGTAA
ncbi:hypothetical protein ACGFW5_03940 [Streptomyces sp. NPDC048416]